LLANQIVQLTSIDSGMVNSNFDEEITREDYMQREALRNKCMSVDHLNQMLARAPIGLVKKHNKKLSKYKRRELNYENINTKHDHSPGDHIQRKSDTYGDYIDFYSHNNLNSPKSD
jgi:hypothetical protein